MLARNEHESIDKTRCMGVMLHPTSLPGPLANGDIGHATYRFIEFLHANGIKLWQMLPLGPTHEDKSPYQCLSAHAGNPELISIDWLVDRGWLDTDSIVEEKTDSSYRHSCLKKAKQGFHQDDEKWQEKLAVFKQKHDFWLIDYALFIALKKKHKSQAWFLWPEDVRQRSPHALQSALDDLSEDIEQVIFEQFVFFTQWHEVREYAASHEVKLFGDIPIFVAHDSADVWAKRKNFRVNSDGEMQYVAGVPPDAFSETGQRWGNPLYNWEFMQGNDFHWWKDRFTTQLELFDMVRLDHFRGLDACWEIPADEETAINGQWKDVPGYELLTTLYKKFHPLPLIAEDLGVITERVRELKESFELPGMKVLQFAFDGSTDNVHLPHQHRRGDVIYTGTHDNDTTLGWIKDKNNYNNAFFNEYSGCSNENVEEKLASMWRMALSSVSFLCVFPMQDLLMLDSDARMNTPGTVGGNWKWRFEWSQLRSELINKLSQLIILYQR